LIAFSLLIFLFGVFENGLVVLEDEFAYFLDRQFWLFVVVVVVSEEVLNGLAEGELLPDGRSIAYKHLSYYTMNTHPSDH
jgi:hypothetical protein